MAGLTDILDELKQDTDGDEISLGDVIEAFEGRGFGPLLLAPALIAMLPTGAIPGVPAICGVFITLVSAQILMGRSHPWMPGKLREVSFDREKFTDSVAKAKPWTRKIDHVVGRRLELLTRQTAQRIVAGIAIGLSLIMIPMEVIPLACAIPGGAIALFALGLSAKDGVLVLLALITAVVAVYFAIVWWPF